VPDPLRILHLIDKNRLTTGSVVQMMEAARGLAGRGNRVSVASRPGGDLEDACADLAIPFLSLPLRGPVDPGSALRLRRQLLRKHPAVVHVHKGGPHAVALLAATGLGPSPVLVVNRGVSFPLDRFNRWKYRHPRVRAVVCVAEYVRGVVIRSAGLDPRRVSVVHGGTDTTLFDPSVADGARVRAELGLGSEDLLIGQVSVRDWKGWRELLAAFAGVVRHRPQARLLFVGCETAAELDKVETAARDLGCFDCVLTLPFRADMPRVLAACDVVADASWTGTGITGTLREGMSMERAVVATDCGGNHELVVDGEVGLLVPPRDVCTLAAALDRLLGDAPLRARLGRAARERVVKNFSTKGRLDRLETLYRDLVARPAE